MEPFVYTKSGKNTDLGLIYSECSGPGGLQLTEFMAEKMQLRAGARLLGYWNRAWLSKLFSRQRIRCAGDRHRPG